MRILKFALSALTVVAVATVATVSGQQPLSWPSANVVQEATAEQMSVVEDHNGGTNSAQWWKNELGVPVLSDEGRHVYVSLDQLVTASLSNSKRIQIANLDGFIEQERVTQTDARFDWTLFAESLFTETNQKTGSDLDAGNGIANLRQHELSSDVGLRRTNRRGGRFEASQNLRLLESNSQFLNPQDQGLSLLTVRYTQPLRKEGGYLVNEGQVILAQFTADATKADSQAEIATLIEEVVNAYWEVYQLRSRYVVQRKLVGILQGLLGELSKRSKIDGRKSLIGQAESEVANQIATLGSTRAQLIQAQLRLVRAVGDRQLGQFHELIPVTHAPPVTIEPDSNATLSLALQLRPEMRAAAKRVQGSELFNQISAQQLLPKLALVLESSVNGINGDFDLGRSLGDQFSEGAPTYAVGFNYELPIGNRFAASRAREAQLRFARELANLEDTVDQVTLDVKSAINNLQNANYQFQVREDAIRKAQVVIDALLKRRNIFPEEFDQISQLYVREILDAQQRVTTAELGLIDLTFDYSKSIIQLRKATGDLVSGMAEATPQVICPPPECQCQGNGCRRCRIADHQGHDHSEVVNQPVQMEASDIAVAPWAAERDVQQVISQLPATNQSDIQPVRQGRYPLYADSSELR